MTDPKRNRALAAAALVLVVAPLALAARWRWAETPDGRQLRPRPDALEYAAAAQAIAAEGRYYLQVGPYQVRPRYPPGWPMVLAGAVRLGAAGDRLWRVAGIFGAGLASLLALLAASAVWRLAGQRSARTGAGAVAAGLVVGVGWALAPAAVSTGRVALCDEPAALVTGLFILGTWLAAKSPSGGRAAAAFGGAVFGLLAGMRPASALLFAPAALVFAGYGWRLIGGRELLRRMAAWACGAAVVPLLVAGLLWRSQLPPWAWSGYGYWAPRWYAAAGTTFNLRYALRGNDDFVRGSGGRPIPNLCYYTEILIGWPGLSPDSYLGRYWPALGWLAGLLLAWRWRRHPAMAAAALAGAAVLAAHVVFYSLYFFPAARFLLPVLAPPLLAAGVACGLGIAGPAARGSRPVPADRASRLVDADLSAPDAPTPRTADGISVAPARSGLIGWGAGLAAAGLLAVAAAGFAAFRSMHVAAFPDHDVRAAFAAWRQLPEQARAATTMPFDPVEAQALGLLPPDVVRQIQAWGALPPTVHVKRLRALGIIPTPP